MYPSYEVTPMRLHGIKRPTRWSTFKHRLRTLVVSAIVMLSTFPAFGAETTLSWTAPTLNTDGTPITNLAGFNVRYGLDGIAGPNYSMVKQIANPALRSVVVDQLGPGKWSFVVTAYNSAGAESAYSNRVQREFLEVVIPNSPLNVQQANINVYSISKTTNAFILLVVGTVPANTACDPNQSVNGHYVVPRAAVTWSGSARPDVVVAKCN